MRNDLPLGILTTGLLALTVAACADQSEPNEKADEVEEAEAQADDPETAESDPFEDRDCSVAETVEERLACRTFPDYDPETFNCMDLPEERMQRSCLVGGTPIRRAPSEKQAEQ